MNKLTNNLNKELIVENLFPEIYTNNHNSNLQNFGGNKEKEIKETFLNMIINFSMAVKLK